MSRCNRIVLFLFPFLALGHFGFAQYGETIRSGRPGQSIGPFTVGKNIFQIQTGIDVYGFDDDKGGNSRGNGFVENTVVRYGIVERFEVSTLFDYRMEALKSNGTKENTRGLSAFDIGGRYHIYTGEGLIPSLGFQLRFSFPILSEDYKTDKVAPRFSIITSQKLSDTFGLVTNWGGTWDGVNSHGTAFYIINLNFPIAGKLGGFVENYGNTTNGDFDTRFDGGFSWMCNNDLQLDLLGGFGNNDAVSDYFVSVGLSWRTKRK